MASVVFFGVIGIGLVFGFTLRSGVDFSGELILWFLCGAVLSVSILGAPPCLHPCNIVCVRVFVSILFGCGFTLFFFLSPFGFTKGGVCCCRRCTDECVELWKTSWCALWPTFFNPQRWVRITPLHLLIFKKILTSCWKAACLPLTISSIGVACTGFSRKFPYRQLRL